MKVILIKPKSEFETLRTEIVLKDHMVDYEVCDVNPQTKYGDYPCEEEPYKVVQVDSQPLESNASVSAEVKPMAELADVDIEPENLGQDFLKAQLSTKNQMKIRNILAIISSISVMVAFILEKLGVI